MVTTARAALSVALLIGFYVYAFGIVVASAALGIWLLTQIGTNQLVVVLFALSLLLAGAVGYATWKVARAKPSPYGLGLPEPRAPALWATVRELSAAVGTRPPDEIRLVAEVNAAVTEHSRLLGLAGGRRYLYIGLPLLQAYTVAQLRFVLAHELGHYSHQHVRLGEPVNRGRYVIQRTLAALQDKMALPRWLLMGYAWVYFAVSSAVSRAQEIEADRAGVRLAGRLPAMSALHELPVLSAGWTFYLNEYVAGGLETGLAPSGVLSYFPTLLAAREQELAEIRAQPPSAAGSRWDSHPPHAERIARMQREPEPPVAIDERPAGLLVPHLDAATMELERATFDFGGRRLVPFPEFTAAAAQHGRQRHADELYRAVARATGGPANLATVLDLLGAGQLPRLAAALLPGSALGDPPAATEAVTDSVASAIAAALVRAGAARWHHSWSKPATLVGPAGEAIDQWDLAARAVSAGEAAGIRDELAARGVNQAAATAEQTSVQAAGAEALAGITNAVVNGNRQDLIITNLGLVIFPTLGYWRQNTVRQRMRKLLTETPAAQLATMPGHRFVAYEEIATAAVTRRFPATFQFVLHSGERLAIRWGRRSDEVGKGWEALGEATAYLTPPQ
jgi:Zn-dependent protease with chaperone function